MQQRKSILGISGYYHDAAAALVCNGEIVAAAQEERFTRKKHDARFPQQSIRYCLGEGGLEISDLDSIVFYDKPLLKFERLLETYLSYCPKGFRSFVAAMPVWLKEKLFLKITLKRELGEIGGCGMHALPPLLFAQHHQSHAASAFYFSPFDQAAILCLDGVGEWATTSAWIGDGNDLTPLWEIDFPHSLGLLYSAFTYFTGFRVNSGEYKLMGLAPYGTPRYHDLILEKLVSLKEDGTFRLDMQYFNYCTGLTMTNRRFDKLFGGPPRKMDAELTQREMDIAASIQTVTEEVILRLVRTLQAETGLQSLCLAGGVALNCVANGRILREGPFEDIWIQPAAGDAGGAIGAAAIVWHQYVAAERAADGSDKMRGAFLGPSFSAAEIRQQLDAHNAVYTEISDNALIPRVAEILDRGDIVGWFQGRMEFGPRALGGRSILGDARNPHMQSVLNMKIKYRESFRPFAPSVLAERVSDYFEQDTPSPYMLIVSPVRKELRLPLTAEERKLVGIEKLHVKTSEIPAVTHVDYSARVQTVHRDTNPRYHDLLTAFEARTGCAVLVNTSFNVRGEPIVCTPADAYRCFMSTEMDYVVIENFLLTKTEQSPSSQAAPRQEDLESGLTKTDSKSVPALDEKGLQQFALVTSIVIVALFGLFLPWLFDRRWPAWPWVLATVLATLAYFVPTTLQPVYRAWMRLGTVLNRITTPIILGLVFFLVITPIGLFRRLFASDPMARKFDDSDSYRTPAKKSSAESLERPF